MAASIVYTVYTKIYDACFLYTEQTPRCSNHVLEAQTCQNVVGHTDFSLLNNGVDILLCASVNCIDDCIKLPGPFGCIVHGSIQFPYTFDTSDKNPILFGKKCVPEAPAWIVPPQTLRGQIFLNGQFSNSFIILSAAVIAAVCCFEILKKYIL
jgi:hypothetical protein